VESKRARIAAIKTAMPQFLIAILIVCLASVQNAQATCQQGCLSNDNTVLGDDALISLTTAVPQHGSRLSSALQQHHQSREYGYWFFCPL
jgi:hypothetical protein